MEYGRREPLKSEPVVEPTAMTMKSIKELLAEEGQEALLVAASEAPTQRVEMPKPSVQQPPHLRAAQMASRPVATKTAKPALKATVAPAIDAELTTPPSALPPVVKARASAQLPPLAPVEETIAPVKRPLLKRLFGG